MEQVFALDPNARAPKGLGEPAGEIEWRGAAGVGAQQLVELGLKRRVVPGLEVGLFQLLDGCDEDFRDEPAAIAAEVA